jgi:hypothetical protein
MAWFVLVEGFFEVNCYVVCFREGLNHRPPETPARTKSICSKQVAFHCPPGNKVMAIIRLRADDSKKNSKNIDPSLSNSTIYDFSMLLSTVGQVPGAEWGRASSRHGGGKILPRAHLVFRLP